MTHAEKLARKSNEITIEALEWNPESTSRREAMKETSGINYK